VVHPARLSRPCAEPNSFISADLAFRADPLRLERLREQFLPECALRGRDSKKFQYAALAAAAVHGGTEPDLLDELSWWQTGDFWQYALFAAAACIRAAVSLAGGCRAASMPGPEAPTAQIPKNPVLENTRRVDCHASTHRHRRSEHKLRYRRVFARPDDGGFGAAIAQIIQIWPAYANPA
jgi:hypothetical protein